MSKTEIMKRMEAHLMSNTKPEDLADLLRATYAKLDPSADSDEQKAIRLTIDVIVDAHEKHYGWSETERLLLDL